MERQVPQVAGSLKHPISKRTFAICPPTAKARRIPTTGPPSAFPTHFAYQQMISTIGEIAPKYQGSITQTPGHPPKREKKERLVFKKYDEKFVSFEVFVKIRVKVC